MTSPTPPKTHYIIHGENNACEAYTPESDGLRTLLKAGEDALGVSQDKGTFGIEKPSVFVFADGAFVDVTEAAAAIVFEKWLADASTTDYPPAFLTDNCKAARDLHEARRAVDEEVAADEAYDLAEVA